MIITGSVIAQKLLSDNVEIDDNVSCQLPSIEFQTGEIKGAGILGAMDMPITGQVNSMIFSISSRGINKKAAVFAKPGIQNIELRFARDVVTADGQLIQQGTKIFITGINKKYDPGKVENGATMDGSIDFEVIRYRQVINGEETLLIDKRNYVYKVNGVDYMQKIRSVLG
ncbi:MAG: phage major tail tube protein [Caulobacteraceae bacterium]